MRLSLQDHYGGRYRRIKARFGVELEGGALPELRSTGDSQEVMERTQRTRFLFFQKHNLGSSLVAQEVKDQHCYCCGSSHCHGVDLIHGPGISTCHGCSLKKKKKKKRNNLKEIPTLCMAQSSMCPCPGPHLRGECPSLPTRIHPPRPQLS